MSIFGKFFELAVIGLTEIGDVATSGSLGKERHIFWVPAVLTGVLVCVLAPGLRAEDSAGAQGARLGRLDLSRGEQVRNPSNRADVPGLAMIRAGEIFYTSSATMHICPGLPLLRSCDLENWELVSGAYDTLADNEALRIEGGKSASGSRSWANSFRYHEGRYYVTTCFATSSRTHIFHQTE